MSRLCCYRGPVANCLAHRRRDRSPAARSQYRWGTLDCRWRGPSAKEAAQESGRPHDACGDAILSAPGVNARPRFGSAAETLSSRSARAGPRAQSRLSGPGEVGRRIDLFFTDDAGAN
eukprot:131576-Chlamydomonas_euryale.AAC.5